MCANCKTRIGLVVERLCASFGRRHVSAQTLIAHWDECGVEYESFVFSFTPLARQRRLNFKVESGDGHIKYS